MVDRGDRKNLRLVRGLGLASLGLGASAAVAPGAVARAVGVEPSDRATGAIRAVGLRELGHAGALLAGPTWTVWTRVAGDALDASLLARAASVHDDERRRRTALAIGAVLAIAAVDLYAAVRSRGHDQHGRGRPGPLKLTASITVNRPMADVYNYWRNLENLPTFMQHLRSVTTEEGGTRSHWVARAPVKKSVEWDAEMTGDEPGRRISWRSLPDSEVDNSGTVHFAPAPDGRGTEVRVVLHYDIPAGAIGRVAATLFGEEPEQQVRDDLRRFKQMLETGEVLRTDALPEGTDARHQVLQRPARPVADKSGRDR